MANGFVCCYTTGPHPGLDRGASALAESLRDALAAGVWPYDKGDDPAFFSARELNGPVTWGVCRQDVRNNIKVGDAVAFFSFGCGQNDVVEYRFVACLKVANLLSQELIWRAEPYAPFRQYLNLLVRPHAIGWEHHEPGMPRREWHSDWLWRSVVQPRGVEKAEYKAASALAVIPSLVEIGGSRVGFARNYIVFEAKDPLQVVMDDPPVVATFDPSGRPDVETWLDTEPAIAIRKATVEALDSARSLRIANRLPHRHMKSPEWTDDAVQAWMRGIRDATQPHSDAPK